MPYILCNSDGDVIDTSLGPVRTTGPYILWRLCKASKGISAMRNPKNACRAAEVQKVMKQCNDKKKCRELTFFWTWNVVERGEVQSMKQYPKLIYSE